MSARKKMPEMKWQSQTMDLLLAGHVVLLGLAAFANSFPGSFILDDVPIVATPLVRLRFSKI